MTDTCSMGRVIDALTAIPTLADYATLFAKTTVIDGPWVESDMPTELVAIGLTTDGDGESGGQQQPRTMGAGGSGTVQEDYGVICQIVCWTGNSDVSAQKQVRDRALALFAAYEVTIRNNRTLEGLLVAAPSGQFPEVWIERNGLSQTSEDVEYGRIAILPFTVHVRNSLNA